ncbi:hypothetical protein OOZ15_17605 [Galbibacter sp. EGI 63066]|uniref:hypothetical protein n=1 Tax=Galbibacter sp. EGI 63066 TaxID=2993559 RepID=UPI002248916F|nr:hypothetical protein [Galbibacter sp. EGI 63066]MCX2681774.1 hypothetical protein [Galbibacter sp. EGI 63066]
MINRKIQYIVLLIFFVLLISFMGSTKIKLNQSEEVNCSILNIEGDWCLVSSSPSEGSSYRELYVDSSYITVFGGAFEQIITELKYKDQKIFNSDSNNIETGKNRFVKICSDSLTLRLTSNDTIAIYERCNEDPKLSSLLNDKVSLDSFRRAFFYRKLKWENQN